MNIKIKDYLLVPSDAAKDRFDLSVSVTRNKINKKREKTGETYEDHNVIGYGMTLGSCITKVISNELANDEKVVSLKEFVEEYEKQRKSIMDILNINI
jgi:hypothetical protein